MKRSINDGGLYISLERKSAIVEYTNWDSSVFKALRLLLQTMAVLVLLADVAMARANDCSVPGTHATIQAAVNDSNCVSVSLAPGAYTESIMVARSLALQGAGSGVSILGGSVLVSGTNIIVSVDGLTISSGCGGSALLAVGGAQINATDTVAQPTALTTCQNGDSIFKSSFESGP